MVTFFRYEKAKGALAVTNKKGEYVRTDIDIDDSKWILQVLDLFDNKISLSEIDNMDLPRFESFLAAKLEITEDKERALAQAQRRAEAEAKRGHY